MKKQKLFILLGLITQVSILSTSVSVAKEIGIWIKEKNFAQINLACAQTWTCHPKTDLLHSANTYVAVTKPQITTGVCSVAEGPTDSCNVCIASSPKVDCFWEMRNKK